MPKNSFKYKRNKRTKTKKKSYKGITNMIGCSKIHKKKTCKKNMLSYLDKKNCPNCGTNCHCKDICNCKPNCPGNCYLNRLKGGSNCGPCGCPIAPLSWKEMNQFGGYDAPLNYGPILGTGQNGGNCAVCSQIPVQNGGKCAVCSKIPVQSGGNFFKPASPVPGPFVGQAWNTNINQWPGVDGLGANRNYLSPIGKVINNDPALQMLTSDVDAGYKNLNSMVGGYIYEKEKVKDKKNKSKNKNTTDKTSSSLSSKSSKNSYSSVKGGGLIPQDLLNLGSDISFNVKSAYNALNGYSAPINPLPYKDQLTRLK
jgi:hypothetical protein